MPESEEEKKKRWAAAAAMSYMTPAMRHALSMSKQQSQNKYKEKFDKTKGKGFTSVASTPEIENAKKQSNLISQNKYKSDFEKNKAKFTPVADDPETRRVSRVGKQISNLEYQGKKTASMRPKKKRENVNSSPSTTQQSTSTKEAESTSSPEKTNDEQTFNADVSHDDVVEPVEEEEHAHDDADDSEQTHDDFREDPQTHESDFHENQSDDVIASHDDGMIDEEINLESNDVTESHDNDYQFDDVNHSNNDESNPTDKGDSYGEPDVEAVREGISDIEVGDDPQTSEEKEPQDQDENSLDDFYANLA